MCSSFFKVILNFFKRKVELRSIRDGCTIVISCLWSGDPFFLFVFKHFDERPLLLEWFFRGVELYFCDTLKLESLFWVIHLALFKRYFPLYLCALVIKFFCSRYALSDPSVFGALGLCYTGLFLELRNFRKIQLPLTSARHITTFAFATFSSMID